MSEPRRLPSADVLARKQRIDLGQWLIQLGLDVSGNRPTSGPFVRAIIILVDEDDETVVTTKGGFTKRELRSMPSVAIRDELEPEMKALFAEDLAKRVAEQQAWEDAHPYKCERSGWCRRAFATEKGRAGHYRSSDREQARCGDWNHGCGPHPCGRLGAEVPETAVDPEPLRLVAIE